MMRKNPADTLPFPVLNALRKLGGDINDARRRRHLSMADLAERAFISRATLHKIERGSPSVSLGYYASALFILGLHHRLAEVADVRHDDFGLHIMQEKLPQRIRSSKKRDS